MTENLTSTERRIFNLLSDQRPHTVQEIRGCLEDPFMESSTVRIHIMRMRRKIQENGAGILFERCNGSAFYRLVRQIKSSYN